MAIPYFSEDETPTGLVIFQLVSILFFCILHSMKCYYDGLEKGLLHSSGIIKKHLETIETLEAQLEKTEKSKEK